MRVGLNDRSNVAIDLKTDPRIKSIIADEARLTHVAGRNKLSCFPFLDVEPVGSSKTSIRSNELAGCAQAS